MSDETTSMAPTSATMNSGRSESLQTVQQLVEALRSCQRSIGQLRTALIVIESPYLDQPFSDDPRWTPWTRFVERPWRQAATASELARSALKAVDERSSVDAHLRVNADMKVTPDAYRKCTATTQPSSSLVIHCSLLSGHRGLHQAEVHSVEAFDGESFRWDYDDSAVNRGEWGDTINGSDSPVGRPPVILKSPQSGRTS